MINRKLAMLLLMTTSVPVAYAQKTESLKIDTLICSDQFYKLDLTDNKVRTALVGAENYIKAIIGENYLKNFRFDYCESRQSGIQRTSKNINQLERLGQDTCYEFQYYAIDKSDTIGYFNLFVDKNGQPIKNDSGSDLYNHPELIIGFKKQFDKLFNFTYTDALTLGKQKGFWAKPFLQCEIENNIILTKTGNVFIKIKYLWSFFQIWDGGHTAILEINAETGKIEKESYIPRMPE